MSLKADEISWPTPNTPFPLLLLKSEYEDEFELEDDWESYSPSGFEAGPSGPYDRR
jgi:hypothetical protein